LQRLLDDLSDKELQTLVDAIGISFGKNTSDIDRDTIEGVLPSIRWTFSFVFTSVIPGSITLGREAWTIEGMMRKRLFE
jgi:hypothetical protein